MEAASKERSKTLETLVTVGLAALAGWGADAFASWPVLVEVLLALVAALIVLPITQRALASFHRWHTIPLRMCGELAERAWPANARRRIEAKFSNTIVIGVPGFFGVFMVSTLSIRNRDCPTAIHDMLVHLVETDHRITTGWFLDRDEYHAVGLVILEAQNLDFADDLRRKCAASFGNGSGLDGWLLTFFPGLTYEEVQGKRCTVSVQFLDVDNHPHAGNATMFEVRHLINLPGLSKPLAQPN